MARLEAEQAQADDAKGRHPDDERRSPRGGRNFKRDYGVPDDKAQSNFTDPESRIMKTSTGFEQCYNGQLAVDGEFQIIVANHQGNNANDNGQLMTVLTEVEAILQARPERCLADAGYRRESDFQALEAQGIDGYISWRRERKTIDKIDRNRYPAPARMAQKLSTPDGKACYSQRKHLVEAVNGWIKNILGSASSVCGGLRRRKANGIWSVLH